MMRACGFVLAGGLALGSLTAAQGHADPPHAAQTTGGFTLGGVSPTTRGTRLHARVLADGDEEGLAEASLELVYRGPEAAVRLGPSLALRRDGHALPRTPRRIRDGDVLVGVGAPRRTWVRVAARRVEVETLVLALEAPSVGLPPRHVCPVASTDDGDAASLRRLVVAGPDGAARTVRVGTQVGIPSGALRFGRAARAPDETVLAAAPGEVVTLTVEGTSPPLVLRISVDGPACAPTLLPLRFVVVSPTTGAVQTPTASLDVATDRALEDAVAEAALALHGCGIVPRAVERWLVPPPRPRLATFRREGARGDAYARIALRIDGRDVACDAFGREPVPTLVRRCVRTLGDEGIAARAEVLTADGASVDLWLEPPHTFDVPGARAVLATGHGVELPAVDLGRGPRPFGPGSFGVGTPEERAWLGPLRDPRHHGIEVVVVPRFSDPSRAGEAFVPSDGGPLAGLVVLTQAALVGGYDTLAHELAHVLLDDPEHAETTDDDVMSGVVASPRDGRLFRRADCDRMRARGASRLRSVEP